MPKDKNLHNVYFRVVGRDWRPEWGMLNPAGSDYQETQVYLNYID